MIIFPIVIIVSLMLYIYYKVTILRSKDQLTQVYTNSKARIFLGIFIAFFGINQYMYYQTNIALYVTLIFLLLGIIQIYSGIKRASHYRQQLNNRKSIASS
ncbi:YtpI family protein [Aquibacillus sediminis]|uniref:YtpI family protein n=1 Tax=Aquibacillus sediminis TaxID=2574734 RepID=UPI0011095991|nr:YtpI family protein [Aquibacillus sediminis]